MSRRSPSPRIPENKRATTKRMDSCLFPFIIKRQKTDIKNVIRGNSIVVERMWKFPISMRIPPKITRIISRPNKIKMNHMPHEINRVFIKENALILKQLGRDLPTNSVLRIWEVKMIKCFLNWVWMIFDSFWPPNQPHWPTQQFCNAKCERN